MKKMGCIKVSTPLLFQSKLLCLSLFYLLTTLPLSIYVSLFQTGCLFTAPPPLPAETGALFSYPKSYGEHKYALPASRSPSSCSSPLPFSDYNVAFQEIRDLCRNSSSRRSSSALRYLQERGESFAGNYTIQTRRSFFNHSGDGAEIPCGFLKEFPVKASDRLAMAKCDGVVVASAIFGDHDKVRQPRGLGSRTLETVCFFLFVDEATIRGLTVHNILQDKDSEEEEIGAWRVVRVQSEELPYDNDAMNGVIPKHLIHRLFPNSMFSIWVDAKLELTVDPLLLIHSLVVSDDVGMAISKHPFNVHTMEEAMATARWKKWGDVESLRVQMETYCENGLEPWSPSKLPYPTDVPDTALIIRRHGLCNNLFSCLLFNELEAFNPRDQLVFAYVRDSMSHKINLNMFEVEVFEQVAIEYRHNLKPIRDGQKLPRTRRASSRGINGSSCEDYLRKMWGEPNMVKSFNESIMSCLCYERCSTTNAFKENITKAYAYN